MLWHKGNQHPKMYMVPNMVAFIGIRPKGLDRDLNDQHDLL